MKIKLDTIEALAKAHTGLAAHFKKMADHHDEMSKAYGEHSAFMKGKHDAMADDDLHKASFKKMADHADAMCKLHKAASEHHAAMAEEHGDGGKAADDALGKDAKTTVGEVTNIGEFLNKSTIEVMGELGKTDEFKSLVRDHVLKAVKEALGQIVPPTTVKAVGTVTDPAKPTLVARPGESLPVLEKAEAPAELSHWFQ
jgi:hypothetical protein